MLRGRSKLFWALVALAVAAVVFYLPSLVAYRYTATSQNAGFLSHPWRSWSFLVAALTVPGDSQLKTSGAAFQRADQLFQGGDFEVIAARLLYLTPGEPYAFSPLPDDADDADLPDALRSLSADPSRWQVTIVPPFRFVWQIEGRLRSGDRELVIAMLDYRSGDVLWDIRGELKDGDDRAAPSHDQAAGGGDRAHL